MIENLKISVSSGNMISTYNYDSIPYCFNIYGFTLPKYKELYPYILSKIKLEHIN